MCVFFDARKREVIKVPKEADIKRDFIECRADVI